MVDFFEATSVLVVTDQDRRRFGKEETSLRYRLTSITGWYWLDGSDKNNQKPSYLLLKLKKGSSAPVLLPFLFAYIKVIPSKKILVLPHVHASAGLTGAPTHHPPIP